MKCEAISKEEICRRKARFKIMDIVCQTDENSAFWICNKCIKHFIFKNENNPHYILIKEKKQ